MYSIDIYHIVIESSRQPIAKFYDDFDIVIIVSDSWMFYV